jgi:hypothetical protein
MWPRGRYEAPRMRWCGINTKAFKEAVAQTLAQLARRGVTLGPATVADTVERNIQAVADQLGIQVRSA